MCLGVVVRDLGKVFSWYLEQIGNVIVPSRQNDLSGSILASCTGARLRLHPKIAIGTLHRQNGLIQTQFQVVSVGRAPIVLQRLQPRWLLVRAHEGQTSDFEKFRRREERHLHWEILNGIDDAALL